MAIGGRTRSQASAKGKDKDEDAPRGGKRRRNIFAEAVATARDSAAYEDLLPEGTWRVRLLQIEELESVTKLHLEMLTEGENEGKTFAALMNHGSNAKSRAVYASNMVSAVRCFGGVTADEFREYDPDGEFVNAMIEGEKPPGDQANDTIIGEIADVQVRRGPDVEGKPGDWYRNHYWLVAED